MAQGLQRIPAARQPWARAARTVPQKPKARNLYFWVVHLTGKPTEEYNTVRPHESLGDISPVEFLNDRGHAEVSSYAWT